MDIGLPTKIRLDAISNHRNDFAQIVVDFTSGADAFNGLYLGRLVALIDKRMCRTKISHRSRGIERTHPAATVIPTFSSYVTSFDVEGFFFLSFYICSQVIIFLIS
jgi:hypothetical protein